MPYPMEYKQATEDFERFLADVAREVNLSSRHQAYTVSQAVFQCFRRRLTLAQAIVFAQALPAMLRALFVDDWDVEAPQATSWEKADMLAEVRALRPNHNLSPDSAIADVARALKTHVGPGVLERALAGLPPQARAFWDL